MKLDDNDTRRIMLHIGTSWETTTHAQQSLFTFSTRTHMHRERESERECDTSVLSNCSYARIVLQGTRLWRHSSLAVSPAFWYFQATVTILSSLSLFIFGCTNIISTFSKVDARGKLTPGWMICDTFSGSISLSLRLRRLWSLHVVELPVRSVVLCSCLCWIFPSIAHSTLMINYCGKVTSIYGFKQFFCTVNGMISLILSVLCDLRAKYVCLWHNYL